MLEGDWEPHRLVIVEFPDMASLIAWYESPEYRRLKAIRERCAKTRIIALEGARNTRLAPLRRDPPPWPCGWSYSASL